MLSPDSNYGKFEMVTLPFDLGTIDSLPDTPSHEDKQKFQSFSKSVYALNTCGQDKSFEKFEIVTFTFALGSLVLYTTGFLVHSSEGHLNKSAKLFEVPSINVESMARRINQDGHTQN